MTESASLLVVGSVAFDDLEMPHGNYPSVLGGSALYSAVAASNFAKTSMVGVVGDDYPAATETRLAELGIDISGLERATGATFRWRGRYSDDLSSRTTLATHLNVFSDFHPKIPAAHRTTPFVLLGNIHPALQHEVLDQVGRPTFVAADTMNLWIGSERQSLERLLGRIDLVFVNDEEARELSGESNLVCAARAISKMGPRYVLIKRGEHGASLYHDDGCFFAPAYPLETFVDPTGAGDSFAGGLMGWLARGQGASLPELKKAMFFAATMGSFCVEGVGPGRLFDVTRPEIAQRIAAFERLIDPGGALRFE
jgi:sugar/nucleoside kinase (ribokinase family)